MDLAIRLKEGCRRSRLYLPWRKWRERQQLSVFNGLLDEFLAGEISGVSYCQDEIQAALAERQGRRRPFLGKAGRPRFVAMGTSGWTEYGLWPSFQRVGTMEFFDYRKWGREQGYDRPSSQYRNELGIGFLAFVDAVDREESVNCAFLYADTKYISSEMLVGLAERGIWSVVMGLDDKHATQRYRKFRMEIGQITLVPYVDLLWTTWKTGAELFRAAGGTPWYAPEAADPTFFHPVPRDRDLEVVFIGQSYGLRADLVRYLRKRGFAVHAFGPGWPSGFVSFENMVELYSRAEVVLGAGGVGAMEGVKHLKARDFEVPMCGAVYLTGYNYELADHFTIGEEVVCYSSFEECAEVLHWLLRHPEQAERIRRAALSRARSEHTWEQRLRSMCALFPA